MNLNNLCKLILDINEKGNPCQLLILKKKHGVTCGKVSHTKEFHCYFMHPQPVGRKLNTDSIKKKHVNGKRL